MTEKKCNENIATRFLWQVGVTPDAIAVTDSEGVWEYCRIAEEAAALARQLENSGARKGTLVGLSVSRGWRVVAGILGIWINECAYVPIDPEYPALRRELIASDARISHIVIDGTDEGLSVARAGEPNDAHALPSGVAYVIYTSGSTGTPKGVIVTHNNVCSLLDAAATVLLTRLGDVGSVFHSYCFDFSVWEIWRMLTAGGRCIYIPAEASFDAHRFAGLLAGEQVTVLNLVPSVFANLVRVLQRRPVSFPGLREVIFGGEPINISAIRAWQNLGLAPDAELINMYGITETTVHVTVKRLSRQELIAYNGKGTPIGRPLPHLRLALLDDSGRVVPEGSLGEIYVTGAGVSAGYLGCPELTAERFLHLPMDGQNRLWYRTGDLGYIDSEGEISFVGRKDSQVKLHGHRIELEEIEGVMRRLPAVADAAAMIVPNAQDQPVLLACYVPVDGMQATPQVLRDELREQLPRYMVPVRLVPMLEFPVTPEGKIDRKRLVMVLAG